MTQSLLSAFALLPSVLHAQGPDLIGYWHNWNDASAPYVELDQVDPRYTVIEVAFAEPFAGTTYDMTFTPALVPQPTFIAQVAALQAAGKKVLISIGGANATVQLNTDPQRDQFTSSMLGIIGTYGFDGIDIDLEGASVSISGGTIATPVDAPIIRLIDAINSIGDQFELQYGEPMMLTMAPETAYVQGGMSAFGGIWGAYLPIIDALRDRIDILQVQLYNSGSMYGIDGGVYTQGSADFIESQIEALLQGFTTGGGYFAPFPPENVAIGLPACPLAAGGGYVSSMVLGDAVNYLLDGGTPPGTYTTLATYPALRGLMTWSINWDAVSTCGPGYGFAQSFEDLFSLNTASALITDAMTCIVHPSPAPRGSTIRISGDRFLFEVEILDHTGRTVLRGPSGPSFTWSIPYHLAPGAYVLRGRSEHGSPLTARLVIGP